MLSAVQDSRELRRILNIPRRVWAPETTDRLCRDLTAALRTDGGSWTLKPIQAQALIEVGQWKGLFAPIRVGGGKTLISLLAPRMVPCARPLLLIPAHLREKTRRAMTDLRKEWVLPAMIRVESYQGLSRVTGAELLDKYRPDLIIADECHYLKNSSAACTQRVARYMKEHYEDVVFVGMSGTITKRSIRDFAHLSSWALKRTNPCPERFNVVQEWSRALDVNVADHRRLLPGALARLRESPLEDIRRAFRRRMVQSPGVIATQDPPLPIALTVRSHLLSSPKEMGPAWTQLRKDYETPDGWECADGVEVWRHAKELAVGCYYVWNPRPPADWMQARARWSKVCREVLKSNRRRIDTELQLKNALAKDPSLYPHAHSALTNWNTHGPTFKPNVEAVWVSDHAVKWIKNWAKQGPGIIWVHHRFLGKRLEAAGFAYHANDGLDATGRFIEDAPASETVVASIGSNGTGRDLQHQWSRNLIVGVPSNGAIWEQLLGRTHRDGQEADEVTVDVLMGCIEDVSGFWRAVEDSYYMEDMTGQAQKLVHADTEGVIQPGQVGMSTHQWCK